MMRFAKKLDGKTNPYSIRGKRSLTETRELLDELDSLGVIRRGNGFISDGDGLYMRTIVRTRNTKIKRTVSKMLNVLLMASFLPILIFGINVYLNVNDFGYYDLSLLGRIVYAHPVLCVWGFNIFSLIWRPFIWDHDINADIRK